MHKKQGDKGSSVLEGDGINAVDKDNAANAADVVNIASEKPKFRRNRRPASKNSHYSNTDFYSSNSEPESIGIRLPQTVFSPDPQSEDIKSSKAGAFSKVLSKARAITFSVLKLKNEIYSPPVLAMLISAIVNLVMVTLILTLMPDSHSFQYLLASCVMALGCGLLAWRMVAKVAPNPAQVKSGNEMQVRFEALEDRAWELMESEERYRSLVEAFGDLLMLEGSDGRIQYCNSEFCNSFNAKIGAFAGETFKQKINHASNSSSNNKAWADALEQIPNDPARIQKTREVLMETLNGPRWFAFLQLPVRDTKNGGRANLWVARDITRFKNIEFAEAEARQKAEQANRAKTKFLAMASHEMRTPLNGIIGLSKLLGDTQLNKEQQNYNRSVTHSGEVLLGLIEDMLDITMIEADRFELKERDFDIRVLMDDIGDLISTRAFAQGLGFGIFIDPNIPQFVKADDKRLRQIILNLAGNAVKYTPSGGVSVHCDWIEDTDASALNQLRISIEDTGPGLDEKNQSRIFEEFERVDDQATRNTSGAGLGLSISRAFAEKMGGQLWLEHSNHKGSVFALQVPVKLVDEILPTVSDAHVLTGMKFKIVCEKASEKAVLSKQLERMGGAIARTDLVKDRASNAIAIVDVDTLASSPKINADEMLQSIDTSSFTRHLNTLSEPEINQTIFLIEPSRHSAIKAVLQKRKLKWLTRPVRAGSLKRILLQEKPGSDFEKADMVSTTKMMLTSTHKILLAEDNDINALLVISSLSKAGFDVHRAINGRQAVETFEAAIQSDSPFACVLMDMHMPVLDGIRALEEIRSIEIKLGLRPHPVLFLTADEQASSEQKSYKIGIDGYLKKPVDPKALIEIVSNACEVFTQEAVLA